MSTGTHAFTLEQTKESVKGRYPRTIQFYRNEHCEGCPLRSQCTRSKHGRTLQRTDKLAEMQIEVRENLRTETGQELLKQQSIPAEGIFGQIKQDQEYDRLWRRKETMVKLELLLVSIGHNLRKYHTHRMQKQKTNQKNHSYHLLYKPKNARYEQVVLMRSKIGIFSLSYKKQSLAD